MARRVALGLWLVALGAAPAPAGGGAATPRGAAGDAAARWAVSQAGTREIGTTNCSPKIDAWERDMGLHVPPCRVWCGAFVHQAYLRAGVRLSARLIDPHRSYLDANAARRGLRAIDPARVRRGDIVFYRFREGVLASHLAIARDRPRGGKLETVEGNVGHAVRLQRRGVQYIVLAARVAGGG